MKADPRCTKRDTYVLPGKESKSAREKLKTKVDKIVASSVV